MEKNHISRFAGGESASITFWSLWLESVIKIGFQTEFKADFRLNNEIDFGSLW